ncbi:MAG: peptidoglycan DD-metalloendopeptidase family protein [bacterium]|nr:peptidoglycan DD-metalloendopeptidase family protein [bacterium]
MIRNISFFVFASLFLFSGALPSGFVPGPGAGLAGETLNEINRSWNALRESKDWAGAERLFTEAIEEHPDAEWLYTNLSWALREQGKTEAAIEVARTAFERFQDGSGTERSRSALAIGYIKRGTVVANAGEHERALTDYRAAYKLLPKTDYVILNYAIALKNVGQFDESLKLFRQGLDLHPEYDPLRRNLVWTLAQNARSLWSTASGLTGAERRRTNERAFALANEAYEVDPTHRGALEVYGRGLSKVGRPGDAIPVLLQGHTGHPDSRAFCWPLSQAYRMRVEQLIEADPQGNRPAALKVAREIPKRLRGEPKCDNSFLFVYDSVYSLLGAFTESIPVLEGLAKRYPDHSTYPANAGEHINRYAVWLRTVQKDPAAAKSMRERGNALLRRAMDVYERNHPDRPKPDRPVAFPLKGLTYVIAAFDSGGTHSGYGKYCYDLVAADERAAMIRPGSSGDQNEDFYGFGQAVYAVRAGIVDVADDGDPDGVPGAVQYQTDGNFVRVRHADGTYASYVHLKRGSLRVRVGQRVAAGEQLGELGNSGMSVSPHLHFCLVSEDYVSMDFRFVDLQARRSPGEEPAATGGLLESGWLVEP